jgi:hypothetical protein
MEVRNEGKGELLEWYDPNEEREWVKRDKFRKLKKSMTVK